MQHILIFGASGTLGRELVLLLKSNAKIVAILREKVEFLEEDEQVIVDIMSINYEEFLSRFDVDTVVYLAQSRKFRDFPVSANDIFGVNTDFPVKLASWAVKNNVKKFLYASSGNVYSNNPGPQKEIFEIDANKENGFYMATKLATEILLRPFSNFFETFLILRPFFMFSEEQEESMLIPRLYNNVKEGREISLQGEEGLVINPIHSKTAAQAVLKLLEKENYRETVNIAGAENISLKEICEIFASVIGKQPHYKYISGENLELIGDNSKMLSETSVGLDRVKNRLKIFAKKKSLT